MRLKEEYREETVINKSRFIACLMRTENEEQARSYIEKIRKEFPDASHVCTAFITGENKSIRRSSDDHEPAGTAGIPMLESLLKSGLTDVTACVVRYFGGIKLGAGGLIRAYSGAVSSAAAHAAKTEEVQVRKYRIRYPYDLSGTLEGWLRRNTEIIDLEYDEAVTAWVLSEREDTEESVRNLSRGTVEAEYVSTVTKEKDI